MIIIMKCVHDYEIFIKSDAYIDRNIEGYIIYLNHQLIS